MERLDSAAAIAAPLSGAPPGSGACTLALRCQTRRPAPLVPCSHPARPSAPCPQLKWFISFLVLVMASFATAFLVLFGPDAAAGRQKREFKGLGRSLVTMLSWVSGGH